MARMKLINKEYYRSQRDRFQNPARFAAEKKKKKKQKKSK